MEYMTKAECFRGDTILLVAQAISGLFVFACYVATWVLLIGAALRYRGLFQDSVYRFGGDDLLVLCSIFFFGCGVSHLIDVARIWTGEKWVLWLEQTLDFLQGVSWSLAFYCVWKRRSTLDRLFVWLASSERAPIVSKDTVG